MIFEFNKICVVGLGYIGLPTASLLATKGFEVHGVDISSKIVEIINAGNIHIVEPDLDVLVKSAVQSGRLKVSLNPASADVFILAVPTPFRDDHVPDISYVEAATRSIAPCLRPGNLVILESTCPVGTTEKVAGWIQELRPDLRIPNLSPTVIASETDFQLFIAHCPERVLPGQILKELVENDRIVGGINEPSSEVAKGFYKQFVSGAVLTTDSRTAELAKLVENTYRDVNIAFANELSVICEGLKIDVWKLIEFANHHPRVNILKPGPGVGGHCIAVDPWFIVDALPEEAKLIRTAREINDAKPNFVVKKVKENADRFKEPTIACFGLAYKANVDDLRESPSVEIVRQLAALHLGDIWAVEPHIEKLPSTLALCNVHLVPLMDALKKADIIVGLVDHAVFREIDPCELAGKIVIDTRGMWHL